MDERQLRCRKEGQKQTGQEREQREAQAGEVGCCTGGFPKKLKKVIHMVIKGGPLSSGRRT